MGEYHLGMFALALILGSLLHKQEIRGNDLGVEFGNWLIGNFQLGLLGI